MTEVEEANKKAVVEFEHEIARLGKERDNAIALAKKTFRDKEKEAWHTLSKTLTDIHVKERERKRKEQSNGK